MAREPRGPYSISRVERAGNSTRCLFLFLTNLLAIALACQRFLDALLLAGLQIERVALDFLDDVFLLHLALEAAQRILKGLTLLQTNLCQTKTPRSPATLASY